MFSKLFQILGGVSGATMLEAVKETPQLCKVSIQHICCMVCKKPLQDGDMVVKWRGTLTHEACWCNVKRTAVK